MKKKPQLSHNFFQHGLVFNPAMWLGGLLVTLFFNQLASAVDSSQPKADGSPSAASAVDASAGSAAAANHAENAKLLQNEPPSKLEVFPPEVFLTTSRDRQTLVVQATYSSGITRDVTAHVKLELDATDKVRLQGATLFPVSDGSAKLKITIAGQTREVPVEVKRAAEDSPISFRMDVMPVFMKSGCNTGSCHGAARGKDGFRLSLFGFDPDGDHYRLTREISGRRINLALPEESALLEKATNAVPHSGGAKIKLVGSSRVDLQACKLEYSIVSPK